jgi:hypothetical protein
MRFAMFIRYAAGGGGQLPPSQNEVRANYRHNNFKKKTYAKEYLKIPEIFKLTWNFVK